MMVPVTLKSCITQKIKSSLKELIQESQDLVRITNSEVLTRNSQITASEFRYGKEQNNRNQKPKAKMRFMEEEGILNQKSRQTQKKK